MSKLLATGKTDLLDKFVSMRTRRAVQGLPGLGQGSGQGQLRVRAARQKFPPRKTAPAASRAREAAAAKTAPAAKAARSRGEEGAPREEGRRAQGAAQAPAPA